MFGISWVVIIGAALGLLVTASMKYDMGVPSAPANWSDRAKVIYGIGSFILLAVLLSPVRPAVQNFVVATVATIKHGNALDKKNYDDARPYLNQL